MDFIELCPKIFHINFKTQNELASTFLRFQEYFESPHFKGQIFSLSEFKSWYILNSKEGKKTNQFTYYSDWSGFNIPSDVFIPFKKGLFNPLSTKEKKLINLFNDVVEPFYVIGTFGSKKTALRHEIAHGLFYTNPKYKEQVLLVLDSMSFEDKEIIFSYLRNSGGYDQSVFIDELHAYVLDGLDKLKNKGLVVESLRSFEEKLKQIFNVFTTNLK